MPTATPWIKALCDAYTTAGLAGGNSVFPGPRPVSHTGPCTTIIPSGGVPVDELPVRQPTVQITCFHTDLETAFSRAEAAFAYLKDKAEWTLTSWHVYYIHALQEPFVMGREDNTNLYRVAFNLLLSMRAD